MSPHSTESSRWLRVSASLTLGIGLLVAAGWVMDWPWARQWLPRSMDTTMNAGVGLIVGAAGLLARSAGLKRSARAAGVFLLLLGAAVLIDLFTGGIGWISRLFWVHPESYMWVSGRMAPHSAVAFLLAGIGLSLADTRWFSRDGERFAAGFVFGTGFLPLVHYATIILFYGDDIHSRNMGLPLACGFMLLGGAQIDWRRKLKGDGAPRLLAGLSAAFITCIAVYMVVGNRLLIETNHEIAQAQEARAAINGLISRVARMESTARAYALTGESDFGNRVDVHAAEMLRGLDSLPALLLPLPGKEADLEELRTLTREKIEAAEKLVNLRATEGLTAAANYLASLPQDRTSRLVRLAAAMLAEEDTRHRRSVGMQQVLETNVRVALGAGGLMVALMMVATSLLSFQAARARQRAEHGLQEVSALQRAVLDGTVLSVIATKPDGTIREFNRGAELMLGYSREEMVGLCTPEVIHVYGEVAAHAAELSARLGRRIEPGFEVFVARARDGQVDEREWTYVRKDGTRFPVQLSVTALRDSEGLITGFLGVAQDLTEKKRAQIALQASEKKLGEVLGHADCLVWEAQVALKPDDWNWQMSVYPSGLYHRLTQQYDIEQGAGLWYRFQIPEQEEMNRTSRAAMERGDAGYVQEFRVIRDGHTTWLREAVAIRRQEADRFWLVGVATDVTDRKLMEEALRSTEERFRSFAQLAPVGICQTDDKGRCLYVNDRWCEITGRPARDFLGKNWATAVHPQDRRGVLTAWSGLVKGGRETTVEYRFLRPEGESRWVAGAAIPLRDAAGHIRGFLGTINDITDRKRSDEALAKSEQQFRHAFDYAGIGMALVSPEGRWLQVNQALRNLLGYSEEELLARTFQDVTHPEDVAIDVANLQDLLAGRQQHYQIEKRYLHRDSHVVHVRLTVTLVRNADGSALHFIAQIEDITARHLAEQALVASQRQLSDVFRSMAEGLVVHDTQGRIIECNTAAETILGLTRDQLLGLSEFDPRWQVLLEDGTPCPPEQVPSNITRMTGRSQRGVILGVHKPDGSLTWVSVNTEPILDEHGYLQSVVASFADITARRQAELKLREALTEAQRFREAQDNIPSFVYMKDIRSRYIYANRPTLQLFKCTAEELVGSDDDRFFSPDTARALREIDRRVFAGEISNREIAATDSEGRPRYYWEIKTPIYADPERREVCGLLGISTDITERKLTQQALAEGEERMRLFAEHAPASVAMFDREMRYLVHSAKWLKDYGLEGRNIIGHSHYEIFPEIGENWREIHRRCLAGATEVNEADPFDRADGTRQWLSWRVQPWHAADGSIGGIVMFTEDITHRKELEVNLAQARDEALAASRLKSEFLANVSHEIRTPMNGVLGMAELLMDTQLTEDQRQMGRVIQSSAHNLLTIIDDLLDFAKIEAGKFRLTTREFNLAEQLEQALALMVPRAVSGQISLQSDWPGDLPARLCGDPGRIQQVLVNLLGNAVKFTERGTVTLAVKPRTTAATGRFAFRVEVRDTGIGIPPDQIPRLFQPFVQADGSSTRRFGGTGLGLAISRQLIELMGGRIGCESQPGHGSVFWFELELDVATGPVVPAAAKPEPRPAEPSARILVAEDQQANQLVMRLLLTKMGVDFTLVGDGLAVIDELGREEYTLVLMDCQMPRMDGYEATRLIRAGAAGPERSATPIVALTAHAMASDREKCLEAGMDDYLSKPVRFESLQPILQRLGIGFIPPTDTTPSVSAATAVLDESQLAQLRALPGRSGPRLLDELVAMALREMPAGLTELRAHVTAQARNPAVQSAHRLAGSAANLGASALRVVLLEIEKAAEAGEWPQVEQRLDGLDREWNTVQQALRGLLPPTTP